MKLNEILAVILSKLMADLPFKVLTVFADKKVSKEEFTDLAKTVLRSVGSALNDVAQKQGLGRLIDDVDIKM